jgi:hypothetical protein
VRWTDLPVGAYVLVDGTAALVLADRLLPFPEDDAGYRSPVARPVRSRATVLTPPASIAVLRHGYVPRLHPTAEGTPERVPPGSP